MNIVRQKRFGPVTAWEFGFGPLGRPIMTVHCYRIGNLLVDTAQSHMRKSVLGAIDPGSLSAIVLTHHHEDHSGNAGALAANSALPVFVHPASAAKLRAGFSIRPYQHLIWGTAHRVTATPLPRVIEDGPWCLTPIHAPGHSKDHTVFFEANHGWLFSGDLFLGERIKYFRADEDIAEQIRSISRILDLDFDVLFCAHRPIPTGGKAALLRKRQFLEDCRGAVAGLAARGIPQSEVVRRLDPGLDRFVKCLTLGNVSYAHLLRSAYRDAAVGNGASSAT